MRSYDLTPSLRRNPIIGHQFVNATPLSSPRIHAMRRPHLDGFHHGRDGQRKGREKVVESLVTNIGEIFIDRQRVRA